MLPGMPLLQLTIRWSQILETEFPLDTIHFEAHAILAKYLCQRDVDADIATIGKTLSADIANIGKVILSDI